MLPQTPSIGHACPTCGLPLARGRILCNGCGGIAPVERTLGRIRRLWRRGSGTALAWARRDPRRSAIWVLASMPFVVGAPLFALGLIAWHRLRRTNDSAIAGLDWVVVIAGANLILSIAFWLALGDQASAWLGELWDWLARARTRPYPNPSDLRSA